MIDRFFSPGLLLRIESIVLLAAAVGTFAWHDGSWWLFAILFLAPDPSFLGYPAGPRIGAADYNLAHASILPVVLLALAVAGSSIAMDRSLGYGLRHPGRFDETHLGR